MSRSPDNIVALFNARKNNPNEKWRTEAQLVKLMMNGEIFGDVTTQTFGEGEFTVVANLAQQNLEQLVKRIVSVKPNVKFASTKPGKPGPDGRARKRRLAALGFWDQNKVEMQDRKRVRWLAGYGSGPVQITTHPKLPIPRWLRRDPLMTYAAPCDETDNYTPDNVIFAYVKTYDWVEQNYRYAAFDIYQRWNKKYDQPCPHDQSFEIIEYIDNEERVIILSHKEPDSRDVYGRPTSGGYAIELSRMENRIGVCPIVAPTIVNLDRLRSPYVGNVGMEYMRNKLAALEYIFAEKTVFADTYFNETEPNGDIVKEADGENGILGHIRGGQLQTITMQPNFAGAQMSKRLEDEERTSNSTPADWSAEGPSNSRTARSQNQIAGAAVDFTIQEMQEILALSKEQELQLAIKVDKTYFNKPKSFNVGWIGNRNDTVDYTPSEIWDESSVLKVEYGSAGSDINQWVISGGQRIAQKTMSRRTFATNDPLIDDAEFELDAITAESLREGILAEYAQPGSLDIVSKARVAELVASNQYELPEAIAQVQKEAQERQATQDAEGNDTSVAPESPEAQPGIAPGQESGIQGAQGMDDLSSALASLRRPQLTVNGA